MATLDVGGHLATVEMASTPESLARGLTGRAVLGPNEGMLLVFPAGRSSAALTMVGMTIPLEAAFMEDDGTIVGVVTMFPGSGPYLSPKPARLALEMPAGWFSSRGIGPGVRVLNVSSNDPRGARGRALGCCDDGPPLVNTLFRELCAQHDQLLALLAALTADLANGPALLDRLSALGHVTDFAALAERHHALEEARLLPLFGKLGKLNDAQQLLLEHRAAAELVAGIKGAIMRGEDARALVATLATALRQHIAHEGRLFREFDG